LCLKVLNILSTGTTKLYVSSAGRGDFFIHNSIAHIFGEDMFLKHVTPHQETISHDK